MELASEELARLQGAETMIGGSVFSRWAQLIWQYDIQK